MIDRIKNAIKVRFQNSKAFFQYYRISQNFHPDKDLLLLFHGIDKIGNQKYNLRFTSQSDFLFIVSVLKKYYRLCSLEEIVQPSDGEPRMAITFDDGYRNWKTLLLPMLEKNKIPVTLFVTTSSDKILWTDQYDIYRNYYSDPLIISNQEFKKIKGFYKTKNGLELNKFLKASDLRAIEEFKSKAQIGKEILERTRLYWELLEPEDIKELSLSKWIEFGSHGCTHASLDKSNDETLGWELKESKENIQKVTNKTITAISFPSGKYDHRVIDFSKKAGYKILLAENINSGEQEGNGLYQRKGIYTMGNRYSQILNLVSKL